MPKMTPMHMGIPHNELHGRTVSATNSIWSRPGYPINADPSPTTFVLFMFFI